MPYAILAGGIPAKKTGIYVGIFNFFIVLPEILASTTFGKLMGSVLNNNRMSAVVLGGVFLLVAALLTLRVTDSTDPVRIRQQAALREARAA
jgi:maltose/moltooligosaccharide transporter